MNQKPEIYIHVGLAKTGSDFLAKSVFPRIPEINLIEKTILTFELKKDKINIISNDGLSGYAFPKFDDGGEKNKYIIANRLKRILPDAKIIICIRKKESWLSSLYRHYIRYGGHYAYDKWLIDVLDAEYIDVDSYLSCLKSLFDDVLVLKFETLKDKPIQFVKEVCDFIGVDLPDNINYNIVNRGWKEYQVKLGLFSNRFFRSKFNPDGWLPYHWIWNPRTLINMWGNLK